MPKLVVFAPFAARHRQLIEQSATGLETVFLSAGLSAETQKAALSDAEIVIGEPEWEAVAASDTLRLLQMTWAGTDKYTRTGKTFPDGIALCNASGAFGPMMAEYAVRQLRAFYPNSFNGQTALILGAGDVGTRTAEQLHEQGATCIGVRRNTTEKAPCFDRLCTLHEAEDWLCRVDSIVCCLPNTPETVGWLNAYRIGLMRQDAVLLNMGRGNFIDTNALTEALQTGRLRGAVLDVTEPEPLPEDHPLRQLSNVRLTPHIAGASFGVSDDTEDRIGAICCENVRRYLQKEPLRNRVL